MVASSIQGTPLILKRETDNIVYSLSNRFSGPQSLIIDEEPQARMNRHKKNAHNRIAESGPHTPRQFPDDGEWVAKKSSTTSQKPKVNSIESIIRNEESSWLKKWLGLLPSGHSLESITVNETIAKAQHDSSHKENDRQQRQIKPAEVFFFYFGQPTYTISALVGSFAPSYANAVYQFVQKDAKEFYQKHVAPVYGRIKERVRTRIRKYHSLKQWVGEYVGKVTSLLKEKYQHHANDNQQGGYVTSKPQSSKSTIYVFPKIPAPERKGLSLAYERPSFVIAPLERQAIPTRKLHISEGYLMKISANDAQYALAKEKMPIKISPENIRYVMSKASGKGIDFSDYRLRSTHDQKPRYNSNSSSLLRYVHHAQPDASISLNKQLQRGYTPALPSSYGSVQEARSVDGLVEQTFNQESDVRLQPIIREGKVLEGIVSLVQSYTVTENDIVQKEYIVEAIDEKTRQHTQVKLSYNSPIAIGDRLIRQRGLTPKYAIQHYIDTDNNQPAQGLILQSIKEIDENVKKHFGPHSLDKIGLLYMVNGEEPGQGTISMQTYQPKVGSKIDVVFIQQGLYKGDFGKGLSGHL